MKHYCKICDMEQEFKKLESGNLLCTKCLSITNIVSDKKDKDDGSNVALSGVTNQLQGKTNKDEQMLVSEDNHAGTFKLYNFTKEVEE